MKSLIITVLLLALAAASFFTRPNQEDFKRLVVAEQTQGDTNVVKKAIDEDVAKHYVDSCTFKDRYLWVTVKSDGQTVYTGAFAHWFNRAEVKAELKKVEQKSKDRLDQLQQNLPGVEQKAKDKLDQLQQKFPKA